MSTHAQTTANQANSQLSTGPATETGKQTSSRNSLKHGLTAKSALLPGEDPAAYDAFAAGFRHDFQPGNTIESSLVEQLIDLQWRLLRVPALEARILSADDPDYRALNNISLHASRMKREFSATLKELQQLIATRIQNLIAQAQQQARTQFAAEVPCTSPEPAPATAAPQPPPVTNRYNDYVDQFLQQEEQFAQSMGINPLAGLR